MLNTSDIMETINMIQNENLDVRTITMGISLLDCADSDVDKLSLIHISIPLLLIFTINIMSCISKRLLSLKKVSDH